MDQSIGCQIYSGHIYASRLLSKILIQICPLPIAGAIWIFCIINIWIKRYNLLVYRNSRLNLFTLYKHILYNVNVGMKFDLELSISWL